MNLSANVKLRKIKDSQASGSTPVTSDVVDTQGYDGVLLVSTIATANAANFIKAQQGAASDLADAADLSGTKIVATADSEVVWLDIYKPLKRYVRAYIDRGGAATVTGDIYAVLYQGRVKPEDNVVTDTIIGELHVSPDEGTA